MTTSEEQGSGAPRVAIREGLLAGDLAKPETVRLCGTRCTACGEVSLGRNPICPNCGGDRVAEVALARDGVLWTYTVVRNRPPGDYRGKDPFVPFGLGLVELPDGIRVLSPLEVEIEALRIGMVLRFRAHVQYRDAAGRDVVAFTFTSAS
jgi:uncharacterized OB-fold protein